YPQAPSTPLFPYTTLFRSSSGGSSSETLNGMIQSDAVIYEGDSGGALVNTSGQVVGMITAGQAQGFRSSASDVDERASGVPFVEDRKSTRLNSSHVAISYA